MHESVMLEANVFLRRIQLDCACCAYAEVCEWTCYSVFYPEGFD